MIMVILLPDGADLMLRHAYFVSIISTDLKSVIVRIPFIVVCIRSLKRQRTRSLNTHKNVITIGKTRNG